LREYLSRWFGADSARPAVQAEVPGAPVADAGSESADNMPFVPVDLSQLTQIWGSESTVKSLLDAFVSAVRDDLRALLPLLNEPDVAALRQWHHRVAGAAGVLQYPPLLGELEHYRRRLTVAPVEEFVCFARLFIATRASYAVLRFALVCAGVSCGMASAAMLARRTKTRR
jgi:hypothetical protein